MLNMMITLHFAEEIQTTCPTCHHASRFTLIGIKEWPEQVAAAVGLPPVVASYTCGECWTTITHVDLEQA